MKADGLSRARSDQIHLVREKRDPRNKSELYKLFETNDKFSLQPHAQRQLLTYLSHFPKQVADAWTPRVG
jgi:calcineurin-like phosphoesterase family protein